MTEAHGSWNESLLGKPFYFFFYYLPNRFSSLGTQESLERRRNVFDFKDGKAQNKIIELVEKKLAEHFSNTDGLTLVCIPASTKKSNAIRYEKFSHQVCSDLNMHNAFQHVAITREKTPSHLGGGDRAEFQLDSQYLRGKSVVLFDDVVTRGRSMREFTALLESIGAHVVACMSIARTYYPEDKHGVLHPWSRGFVEEQAEKENRLSKETDSSLFKTGPTEMPTVVSVEERPKTEVKQKYKVGDIIKLGRFAGKEIEWQVLDNQPDKLLVISRYGLINRPFNDELKEVSWVSSSMRKWLNKEFFQSAFSQEEQKRVIEHSSLSDDIEEHGIAREKFNIKDRVSLLSVDEYMQFFGKVLDWRCPLLPRRIDRQCWLRTTGKDLTRAAFIGRSGSIHAGGSLVNSARNAVRPIIWLKA